MRVASFEVLLTDVLVYAPHCPEGTALHALRLATIDFCSDTLWWKFMGDPQDVVAGEPLYDAEIPSQTEVVAVTSVWFQDRRLQPQGHAARFLWPARNLEARQGPPQYYVCPSPSQVQLQPVPDSDETAALQIQCALVPTRTATTADAELLSRWSDGLTFGALSRVMSIPNQSFTNMEEAKRRYAMFRQEVTQAKIAANKASTLTSLYVKQQRR